MSSVRLTKAANRDLQDIWKFIAADNRSAAQAYTDKLRSVITQLGAFPELGRARDGVLIGMRSIAVESHLIFYTVSGRTVRIIRILHSKQDVARVMKRLG